MARVGCGLCLLAAACGGDDADEAPKAGAGGAKAGAGAGAGRGSSTSASTAGGSGGGSAAGRGGSLPRATQTSSTSDYKCQPKPEDKGSFGSQGARCCAGLGSCTQAAGLSGGSALPHDTCSADSELVCQPNPPAANGDADAGTSSGYASCRVKFPGAPADFPDYEGRCLPACFAQKSPIAARLSQATCAQGELCTPCYDPLTGDATGSCELRGDKPQEAGPKGFEPCASDLGYCVPAFAAGMFAGDLMQLTCKAGELCGPKNKVADPSACFERCDSAGFGPGACVPQFLATNFAAFLAPTSCTNGNLCAPCSILGQRTGVCD
jgi:hypothetical protein